MKGYKLDKTLYIFDATPATIPVSVDDVDIIYVQQELLAAYVNANQDAANKIKPYNYKLLVVNKLPWADYIDNDLVEETTEYTVSVNYGQTLLETLPDGLPFEPSIPYSTTEGTQLVFTLPAGSDWENYEEGNIDNQTMIQIQYPESIQNSYEIVWPYVDEEDPENPVNINGTLSFTMPAENVTLNIDLVENPYYTAPPVETELTVVNNLPEGYTCEVAILSDGDEEPVPVEDITSNITVQENAFIGVKVLNENSEVVNYYPDEILNGIQIDGIISNYDGAHENVEVMQHGNVYCSIEGEFNDEITTSTLDYSIAPQRLAADNFFGYGESFYMPPIPLTLTIQKP